jgi:hypothetical protein
LPAVLSGADKFTVERTCEVRFPNKGKEGGMKSKGRDSARKPRPFPSFDRVARQQSPTGYKLTRDPMAVKSTAFP